MSVREHKYKDTTEIINKKAFITDKDTDGDGEVEIALTSAVLNSWNCKDFMRDNL